MQGIKYIFFFFFFLSFLPNPSSSGTSCFLFHGESELLSSLLTCGEDEARNDFFLIRLGGDEERREAEVTV